MKIVQRVIEQFFVERPVFLGLLRCEVVFTVRAVHSCCPGTWRSCALDSAKVELIHKLLSMRYLERFRRYSSTWCRASDRPSAKKSSPCTIMATSILLLQKHGRNNHLCERGQKRRNKLLGDEATERRARRPRAPPLPLACLRLVDDQFFVVRLTPLLLVVKEVVDVVRGVPSCCGDLYRRNSLSTWCEQRLFGKTAEQES